MPNSSKEPFTGLLMRDKNLLDRRSQSHISVTYDPCDGRAISIPSTFSSHFGNVFRLTNGFEMRGSRSPILGMTIDKNCFFDVVS